ncbi:MAG: hypothetical protein JEZ06_23170 [Anaerolineaceae bacterium]|nr:hypothetical protein [Anaerolineaceae bacterium]
MKKYLMVFLLTVLIMSTSLMCAGGRVLQDILDNSKGSENLSSEQIEDLKNEKETQKEVSEQVLPTSTNLPEPTDIPESEVLPGSVTGRLSFPSEFIPEMEIVAFEIQNGTPTGSWFSTHTDMNAPNYLIDNLTPGKYWIVAYPIMGSEQPNDIGGGYSEAVLCGLQYGCDDHTLLEVEVIAGQVSANIDPGDWYADPGVFPKKP